MLLRCYRWGCTQANRFTSRSSVALRDSDVPVEPARVRAIGEVVRTTLTGHQATTVELGRVNIAGAQIFIEVFTDSLEWSTTRHELIDGLRAVDENPITSNTTEPMHLNIGRMTVPPKPGKLRELLSDTSLATGKPIELHVIELVITDFLVTPGVAQFLGDYELSRPCG